jgi:hypothetical protein
LNNKDGGIILKQSDFFVDHLEDGRKITQDYKIEDVLGSGAYGEVRSCVHKASG